MFRAMNRNVQNNSKWKLDRRKYSCLNRSQNDENNVALIEAGMMKNVS